MIQWPSVKAKRLLAALLRLGWQIKDSPARIKYLLVMAGLILFSLSVMATKSAQKCWRALQSILGCLQMICNPKTQRSGVSEKANAGAGQRYAATK
jgi:hypothetical protein